MFSELGDQSSKIHSHIKLVFANDNNLLLNAVESILDVFPKVPGILIGLVLSSFKTLKSRFNALKSCINSVESRLDALAKIVEPTKECFNSWLRREVVRVHIVIDTRLVEGCQAS